MSDDGTFIARYPDGRRVRLRWPVHKELDDRETSRFTGAQYPRTRRSFLEVLEDRVDDEESDDSEEDDMDINKADRGAHDLAGSLLRHLQDRLDTRREQHGYQKREKGP